MSDQQPDGTLWALTALMVFAEDVQHGRLSDALVTTDTMVPPVQAGLLGTAASTWRTAA